MSYLFPGTGYSIKVIVLCHLDFANAVLAGLPDKTIHKLQLIQNWAAKVVLLRKRRIAAKEPSVICIGYPYVLE